MSSNDSNTSVDSLPDISTILEEVFGAIIEAMDLSTDDLDESSEVEFLEE